MPRLIFTICMLFIINLMIPYGIIVPAEAKKAQTNSPLTAEQQVKVKKASNAAKSGKIDKAGALYTDIISQATTAQQCLAIAQTTERYGQPLLSTRRACLERAMAVSNKDVDLFSVALRARQYQL